MSDYDVSVSVSFDCPASLKLADAVAELERPFTIKLGFASYVSQTGETYTEVTSAGTPDGVTPMLLSPNAGEAVSKWLDAAKAYAAGHSDGSTLYWRVRPEIDELNGQWWVYSRFLITQKPEIKKDHPDYMATFAALG